MEKDYTKIKYDRKIWNQTFKYLSKYWKQFVVLVVLMFALAAIDVLIPYMMKVAIDDFVGNNSLEGYQTFAISYIGLVVLLCAIIYLFIKHAGRIEMTIVYDLRKDAFEKLQRLSFSYYDKNALGWLMSRVTSDITRIGETIAWGAVDMFWGLAMMIGIAYMLLTMHLKLGLITLSVLPILAVLSVYFQKRLLYLFRNVRKINSLITGAFNEGILGAITSKTLVREDLNINEFEEKTSDMRFTSVKAAKYSALYLPMVLILGNIGTALAIYFGGNYVLMSAITYGTLVLFINYTMQFFEPIMEMARIFKEMLSAQASLERVLGLLDEEESIEDTASVLEKYGDYNDPSIQNYEHIKGNIQFKQVEFSYKDGEVILEDFNLEIEAGQTVALVGHTGSGKSTIVNLLCRFYEPTKGEISIDGINYKERSIHWLHSNLGYVLQSPHLFSGTIKDNIKYGKLDATDDEVMEVARLVNAEDFILKLKDGYDTEVGEGGAMLSTGEKQLISFARAIIGSPSLFVLDEATSSVDTETEFIIQNAIEHILENRTSFIIAHRLSTIKSADLILVIDQGRIVEKGTHEQLLSKKGHYYNLYKNQYIEEQNLQLLA